ncbi:MAG: Rpn family recombination-promoting nuclease/putative transposase, partial [Lachnospiraceae bacterium]|nr:Rpn family recombination-promoting nuclease/putative transposase [Lachnospiraceae bacterium]
MSTTGNEQFLRLSKIDFDILMDLRVDYAFKLLFTKGAPRLLISLLNAVFANKGIQRLIKSITIKNPYLDKEAEEDKLSILDIRAELDDGTSILIEMHMYGLGELKAKTIRSWARAHGEVRGPGEKYSDQPPTIVIAFADGQIHPLEKRAGTEKIHRCCMIMDCEDYTVFTDAMELHYIDMKAFARAVNEAGSIDIGEAEATMFARWLSIITQKEITDKSLIERACEDEEDIKMAVSTLARQSEDKYARQAYQRRL